MSFVKKILLCPPSYYDIEYEINPWMHISNKVDRKKVKEEFEELKNAYKSLNVEILEIPQEKGLPDMVYSANYGFPFKNIFIKSNFKFNQRKPEADLSKLFLEKLGFEIKELPENINWEGQGDLLTTGVKYFLGWGNRSDKESKKYLEKILGQSIIDFEMINPYYYHLDTCFLPLNQETVAINPKSFTSNGLAVLKNEFKNVIEVSEQDNNLIACNAVVVGKAVVIGKGISDSFKEQLSLYGFLVQEVEMGEYRKGGGSVKCLTLEFY